MSEEREDPIEAANPWARCAVCLRPMALRRDGAIHVHGLVSHRCAESGQEPSSISLNPATVCHPSLTAPAPPTYTPATACSTRPQRVPILKRLPCASRDLATRKLATILEQVTATNDVITWMHLLYFSSCCFHVPKRGVRCWNLVKLINQQLAEESDPPLTSGHRRPASHPTIYHHQRQGDPGTLQAIAARISVKLEEGDFRSVVRLACSEG